MHKRRDIEKAFRRYMDVKVKQEKEPPPPYPHPQARWPEDLKMPANFAVLSAAAAIIAAIGMSYLLVTGYRDHLGIIAGVLSERYHWREQIQQALLSVARYF